MKHTIPSQFIHFFKDYGVEQTAKKNKFLFVEGEPAHMIYLIKSGSVATTKETANGRELTIRISSVNDCIAENILFTPLVHYPTSAKIVNDATVLALHKNHLEQLIHRDPNLLIELT
ncbi:MAG: cyclic nucleotide-binding domain-containing protein, partial [Kurthia sp.]